MHVMTVGTTTVCLVVVTSSKKINDYLSLSNVHKPYLIDMDRRKIGKITVY